MEQKKKKKKKRYDCMVCWDKGVVWKMQSQACRPCKGTGQYTHQGAKKKPCKPCEGTGKYTNLAKRKVHCIRCDGTGERIITFTSKSRQCDRCEGTGIIMRKKGRACPSCQEMVSLGDLLERAYANKK